MQKKQTIAAIGIITGFANGLFGAGGGSILVPAMEKLLGIETHKAHATAIGVILPISVMSAVIYVLNAPTPWETVLYASLGGTAGGYVGANLLNKLTPGWLHKIFGGFIIVAAIKMIMR